MELTPDRDLFASDAYRSGSRAVFSCSHSPSGSTFWGSETRKIRTAGWAEGGAEVPFILAHLNCCGGRHTGGEWIPPGFDDPGHAGLRPGLVSSASSSASRSVEPMRSSELHTGGMEVSGAKKRRWYSSGVSEIRRNLGPPARRIASTRRVILCR